MFTCSALGPQVNMNPSSSVNARFGSIGAVAFATLFAATSGCGPAVPTVRMNANFDGENAGSPPSGAPSPTPPADALTWTVRQPLSSKVVVDPAGGRSVLVTPLAPFAASPDEAHLALIATTETLSATTGVKLRGSMRLALNQLGTIIIGFEPVPSNSQGSFIAGIQLGNFLGKSGAAPPPGEVDLLRPFVQPAGNAIFALASAGTLGSVTVGSMTRIAWTIDPSAGTFSASAENGTARSVPLPPRPMTHLRIYVWLQQPQATTTLTIDDLFAEEF